MGWSGYGIYDGDETQSLHLEFLKRAKVLKSNDYDAMDRVMQRNRTVLNSDEKALLKKNIKLVLKKMPKPDKFMVAGINSIDAEWAALEWQMLAALFLDNNMSLSREIKKNGKTATEFLMRSAADDYNEPWRRRKVLKVFLKKISEA